MKATIDPSIKAMIAQDTALLTLEQTQPVGRNKSNFVIGVPKEEESQENRIALIPDAVRLLVNNGHTVNVETNAGAASKFSDREYSDAGAYISYSSKEVYQQSNIIVKISPPSLPELENFQMGTTLFSALQFSQLTQGYIAALNNRKVTAIAFELLQDEIGGLPIVRSMSEIAGSTVMLIAADYLNSNNDGRGVILGGITGVPPTKVVILGAGTAAEFAARTALGLGAEVKIFDSELHRLRRIKQELGAQLFTSILDIANLSDAIQRADVLVGAMRAEDGRSPCVVTEEMVASMKPNSVIVDISIDQGGNFETSEVRTHASPTFKKYDVIHYCVPNIASRVAHTASIALSNVLGPLILKAQAYNSIDAFIFDHVWFMKGVYTYKGNLTNKHFGRHINMRHKDLNLFRLSNI